MFRAFSSHVYCRKTIIKNNELSFFGNPAFYETIGNPHNVKNCRREINEFNFLRIAPATFNHLIIVTFSNWAKEKCKLRGASGKAVMEKIVEAVR